ncbi:glycosyltransferase family 2 protein [Leeuwenhoekiella parthenopeia]|uniref:Glycosyltransferase family 2 protein n=1 Tax=Leeuwenhoekiella parthenopeia TaxID=2890320 RepID=A0ABS8GMA3_9FLAO|nr:glycosyltransferase family 2 protein [Leeuwenhoekiella parthenopeia]MCC4211112.1 glycosyltransferase family 2 protein [Leeuwenhoekiella parthenopeia]
MTISLLLTTYNWPEALELVLLSVLKQSHLPDEVLIADDGSETATSIVIEKFKQDFPNNVQHLWHEDKGFRKSKILNRALLASTGDYVIQIDGDCILHSDFIKDHKENAVENVFLFGSRVNIRQSFLPHLLKTKRITFHSWSTGIKKRSRALHLPFLSKYYKASSNLSSKIRGCNISYWKKNALDIQGYDESYEGWGREDSDFAARLLHSGVKGKRIRYAGIIFHIWHPENSRKSLEFNNSHFELVLKNKSTLPRKGIE